MSTPCPLRKALKHELNQIPYSTQMLLCKVFLKNIRCFQRIEHACSMQSLRTARKLCMPTECFPSKLASCRTIWKYLIVIGLFIVFYRVIYYMRRKSVSIRTFLFPPSLPPSVVMGSESLPPYWKVLNQTLLLDRKKI